MKNTIRLFTITLALSLVACTSVEKKEFFYEVVGGAMIENEINSNQDIKKVVDLGYSNQQCLSVKRKCTGDYTEWLQNDKPACRCVK